MYNITDENIREIINALQEKNRNRAFRNPNTLYIQNHTKQFFIQIGSKKTTMLKGVKRL